MCTTQSQSSTPTVTLGFSRYCTPSGKRADSLVDQFTISVPVLSNDLCGVTTGRPTPFNTTAYVSPFEDFHVISPFVWLGNKVYVGIEVNLPWAQKYGGDVSAVLKKIYLSGRAVNTSAWDGTIYEATTPNNFTASSWNITNFTCIPTLASSVAKNLTVCFEFPLLKGYFIRDHYLRITAQLNISVKGTTSGKRSAAENMITEGSTETFAFLHIMGGPEDTPAAPEAVERHLAIAAPEQKQTVRYEYQYHSVPAVAAAAAFVATALVAAAAFFVVRASRGARATSL